ncbi:MAG: hypothetical protein AUK47_27185 [Deltaproteobacteria bacterium CG2_30_63_29]|nr:MAG: hypothetical protein AUK47_27185 [Deltaproteobacteria bacterium CG2_30_63_29]
MTDTEQAAWETGKTNILLVDDNPAGLLTLEAILGDFGHNLVKAGSGKEALRQVMAHDFAVILLDVQMPDMDGYETARLIGERPQSRNTPIIFLTATNRTDAQRFAGYQAGAVDYLFKPLDPDILRAKVSVFVRMHEMSSLLKEQAAELSTLNAGLEQRVVERTRELVRANLEILSSEQKFSKAFQTSPYAITLTGAEDGRFVEVNDCFSTMTGFSREEALASSSIGMKLWIDEADRAHVLAELRAGRAVVAEEYRFRSKTGEVITGLFSAQALLIGDAPMVLSSINDITGRKRLEFERDEARSILEAFFNSPGAARGVCELDGDNLVPVVVNKTVTALLAGYGPGSLLEIRGLMKPDLIAQWTAAIASCTENQQPVVFESYVGPGWGEIAWNETVLSPMPAGPGARPRFAFVCTDITAHKQAEQKLLETERRWKTLFEAGTDGFVVADAATGALLECNPLFGRMTGYSPAEVTAMNMRDLHPPEELASVRLLFEAQARGELRLAPDVPVRRKDGSLFCADVSSVLLNFDHRPLLLGMFRDVTDRKSAEEARIAAEVAQSSNREKSAFLANMSHEIRTPMNAILGFAQLLRRDAGLTSEQRQQVDTILRAGDHLLALIHDVLALSKIESGRMSVEPSTFDLFALLEELVGMFRQPAEAKGLRLVINHGSDMEPIITTDDLKLRQIVQNLLSNAVKFTASGGVALRVAVRQDVPASNATRQLVVEVEDSGAGIPPEEMTKLFKSFEQTTSGKMLRSGTGLGLAISRKLAELLGGTLEARSELGKGSTFRLEIPVKQGRRGSIITACLPAHVKALATGQPVFRVLVVDDNEDNRSFLMALLLGVGFDSRSVNDGAQAVLEAEAWAPHLILMDMQMPILSGAEAIGRIRRRQGGAAVKILAVTANAFDDDRQAAIKAGADDYLAKPFREEMLFAKMQALLGVRYQNAEDEGRTPAKVTGLPAAGERAAVARLPEELVDGLRWATLCADFDAIVELISRVEPHSTELAQEMGRLVNGYDYANLLVLLNDA